MEAVQKEHERIWKASQTSKIIDQTQDIIDALQKARDTIAATPGAAPVTLAKLQTPVKASFEGINASLKEIYGGHNKYAKALDKFFKDKPFPSNDVDVLSSHPTLINRAIYLHLLREGLFDVATTLHTEASARVKEQEETARAMGFEPPTDHPLGLNKTSSENMEREFASMYHILSEIKEHRNLQPAIEWARKNTAALEMRGSNLEFELCRLQYVSLFLDPATNDPDRLSGQMRALAYAQREFQAFRSRYLLEISQLLGAMAYSSNLEESPYHARFNNTTAWDEVANYFTREFCSLLELSADSPLYIAATAGAIALPPLLKYQSIAQKARTEWTSENELPVETPLPPAYQFHSIFVCPVSKEQTTDQNPPMMLPCCHVLAQESIQKYSKGSKFKCPYCPVESHPKEAKRVFL